MKVKDIIKEKFGEDVSGLLYITPQEAEDLYVEAFYKAIDEIQKGVSYNAFYSVLEIDDEHIYNVKKSLEI